MQTRTPLKTMKNKRFSHTKTCYFARENQVFDGFVGPLGCGRMGGFPDFVNGWVAWRVNTSSSGCQARGAQQDRRLGKYAMASLANRSLLACCLCSLFCVCIFTVYIKGIDGYCRGPPTHQFY